MRGRTVRALGTAVAVAVACDERAARADESARDAVRLVWRAPPGCPTEASVLGEMRRILGGPPSRGAEATADIEERAPRRWTERLSTTVEGAAGERSLEADSCDGLAAATALILAWTIDPQRAAATVLAPAMPPAPAPSEARAPPPPDPSPNPPPPSLAHSPPAVQPAASNPQPATPPRAVEPPAAGRRALLEGVAAVEAAGDLGVLPRAAASARVSLGVLLRWVRVEASVTDSASQDVFAAAPLASQGATLHPIQGGVRACARWHPAARFELDPCLAGGLTYVTSTGIRENLPLNETTSWATLYGGVLAAWTLAGPLALRATASASVPSQQPSFVIQRRGEPSIGLYRVSPVGGQATLGVEVRFP